jgi:hypothetical protein
MHPKTCARVSEHHVERREGKHVEVSGSIIKINLTCTNENLVLGHPWIDHKLSTTI